MYKHTLVGMPASACVSAPALAHAVELQAGMCIGVCIRTCIGMCIDRYVHAHEVGVECCAYFLSLLDAAQVKAVLLDAEHHLCLGHVRRLACKTCAQTCA